MKHPNKRDDFAFQNAIIALAIIAAASVFFCEFAGLPWHAAGTARQHALSGNNFVPPLTPWQSIGGCGVGGGTGGGAAVPWLGQGVPGAIIDAEVRVSGSMLSEIGGGSSTCQSVSLPLSLNFHPRFADITVNAPLQLRQMEYGSQQSASAAGWGDLHLTLSKALGMEGQFSAIVGLGLPTGKSDIHDLSHNLLPSNAQLGGGTFGANLGLNYTMTRGWGTFLLGAGYSTGLFYLKTADTKYDTVLQRAVATKRSFAWAHMGPSKLVTIVENHLDTSQMGFGAVNDMGVMTPDNIDCHAYISIKAERLVHSLGLIASIPTGYGKFDAITTDPFSGPLVSDFPDKQTAQNYVDTAKSSFPDTGSVSYKVVGTAGGGASEKWVVEKRATQLQKVWPILSVFYALEIGNEKSPVFCCFAVPVEFNGDDGVGIKGFSADLGLKFPIY